MMKPLLVLLLATGALAHDEGHGPKLLDAPPKGGVLAPVIDMKDRDKVLYKAELVRSEEGVVRVYIYDNDLKPLDAARFAKTAKGDVEIKRKGKFHKTPFTLTREDGVFVGKAPKPAKKPFNIDVHLKEGKRSLFCAFDNLD